MATIRVIVLTGNLQLNTRTVLPVSVHLGIFRETHRYTCHCVHLGIVAKHTVFPVIVLESCVLAVIVFTGNLKQNTLRYLSLCSQGTFS